MIINLQTSQFGTSTVGNCKPVLQSNLTLKDLIVKQSSELHVHVP